MRKKKEADGTHTMGVCNRTESHVWYLGPSCKGCYESAARIGKRKMETALGTAVALDLEDLQEESQEILVEIEEIYAVRWVFERTRDPQPVPLHRPSITCHAPQSHALTCVSDPNLHRMSKIPRERRVRRNPLDAEEKALEYDVYGKFEFDLGSGKMAKPEWGRRWCSMSECAQVSGWVNDLKQFEIDLAAMRVEAEDSY